MALENVKKNLPESRISNNYWLSTLSANDDYGIDYDAEYEAALNSVTAEDVKALLQKVLAEENMVQIMLAPAE
jgi:predicted Zn-dependent peptidase